MINPKWTFESTAKNNHETRENFDWEVKYNRWALKILGLWPLDNRFVNLKFSVYFVVLILHTLPSIVEIAYIRCDVTLERLLQIINGAVALLYSIVEISVFKSKSSQVKVILTRIYEDWNESSKLSKNSRKPMLVYGSKVRLITVLYLGFYIFAGAGYCVGPFVTMIINGNLSTKYLPNKGFYPFPTDISPIYEIIYATQAVGSLIVVMTFFSIDSFFVLSGFHGCAQLAVLSKIISHYDGSTKHRESLDGNSKNALRSNCTCLKCIVDNHVSLCKFVEVIDDVFHIIIIARLIINTINFGGMGYIMVKLSEDSNFGDLLIHLFYMLSLTWSFFMYCWIGEQLSDEGENIGRSLCKLNWYNQQPKKVQSLMLLPIIRSRRSLKITAGKFFVVSLAFYKEWLLKCMGYVSVLLAFKSHS